MLLRGIYTFDPRPQDHDQTLPFTCNDNLIFLEVLKRDSNWIKVGDILGRVGYVPKDFVEPDDHYFNHDHILSFLADAIIKARQNGLPTAPDLERLKDEIRQHPSSVNRRSLEMAKVFRKKEGEGTCKARKSVSDHLVNKHSSSREAVRSAKHSRHLNPNHVMNDYPCTQNLPEKSRRFQEPEEFSDASLRTASDGNFGGGDVNRKKSRANNKKDSASLKELKSELVSVVTARSGLNSKNSEDLVCEVLQRIKKTTNHVPVDSLLKKLTISSSSSEIGDCGIPELEEVIKSLSHTTKESIKDCRRSTGRGSESSEFSKKLDKLRKLLIECDPFQVVPLLEVGQHKFSHDLVHLYHLESPPSIKERMLDIFLIICTLDKKGRVKLLSSSLPIYLARELMAAKKERKFSNQLYDLLTVLLSCGESMPETHFEILGTGFVNFLLKELEDAFAKYDAIADKVLILMNLILAYNLQFHASKENIVLKVLAERRRPVGFIDVLIQLFQKATDPLLLDNIKEDYKTVPNATFKMMHDICLCQRTFAHFTTSDMKTLVDTIVNGLVDNKAGDTRLGYLQVLWNIMGSVHHNEGNIRAALMNIFLDPDPLAFPEQQMIRSISKEYPALFLQSISRLKTNLDTDNLTQDDGISYLSS